MTDYKANDDKKKDMEMLPAEILSDYVLTLSYTHV